MAAQKGHTKAGGRKKGTPNKTTADIKTAFREHGQEFVRAMLKLTKSKDENVRLKALQICLDRGYGKAVQHIEAEIRLLRESSEAILPGLAERTARRTSS